MFRFYDLLAESWSLAEDTKKYPTEGSLKSLTEQLVTQFICGFSDDANQVKIPYPSDVIA